MKKMLKSSIRKMTSPRFSLVKIFTFSLVIIDAIFLFFHFFDGIEVKVPKHLSFLLYILPDPLSSIVGRCTLGCRMKAYK